MTTGHRVFAFAVGAVALFLVGFSWTDISTGDAPNPTAFRNLVVPQSRNLPSPTEVFRENFSLIRNQSAVEVDSERLRFGAMSGVMASLGDPHNVYLEPKVNEQFGIETAGDFVGIGARLSPDPLGARVVSVFPGGPALNSGMKPGDIIVAVDGVKSAGKEVDDIVVNIRGEAGSPVKLTVNREGEAGPLNFTLKRAQVFIPIVEHKLLAGDRIGYISVSQFSETAPRQFDEALIPMSKMNLDGIIIDLRGNPGGLLEAAAYMLGRFFDGKVVVTMRKRGGDEEVVRTPMGRRLDMDTPVVLLMNEDSASASEIFAGVMHDYQRATIIGDHSYGKASVQQLFQLRDGSAAKITIAGYYLPKSDDISRKVDEDGMYIRGGIAADIEVKLNLNAQTIVGDEKSDNQLQEAIKFLLAPKP